MPAEMKRDVLFRRVGALLIDLLIISAAYSLGIHLLPELFPEASRMWEGMPLRPGTVVYGLLVAGYFLGCDLANNGESPGKDILGLRTVGRDGNPPGLRTSLVRSLLKSLSVGLLPASALAFLWKGRGWTLQDALTGTSVERIRITSQTGWGPGPGGRRGP